MASLIRITNSSLAKAKLKAFIISAMQDLTFQHLLHLGLSLPEVPQPVAAYVNCIQSGKLLYLSGGLPIVGDTKILGKVPSSCSIEQAVNGSRIILLNRLAIIKQTIGSLDRVKQIIAINGFVNSEPDFTQHPVVINGASELLIEIFGERGKHSRTALGVCSLPLNVAVEINMIVEID